MFTGLIEELGTIKKINQKGEYFSFSHRSRKNYDRFKVGDSIAVNGVCLTVTTFSTDYFEADVMPETFKNTSLSFLKRGF